MLEMLWSGVDQLLYFRGRVFSPRSPVAEITCFIPVAQKTESGVIFEPAFVFVEKRVVWFGLFHLVPCLIKNELVVSRLHLEHFHVVDIGFAVQYVFGYLEFIHQFFVVQLAQLVEVEVHGVKGKYRYGFIRVGIEPRMGCYGFVYRQDLYHLQSGQFDPVNQHFQIIKFAHAKAVLCSQAENRHGNTGAFPFSNGISEPLVVLQVNWFSCFFIDVENRPFCAVFPNVNFSAFGINNHIFVFNREMELFCVKFNRPFWVIAVVHQYGFVPYSQTYIIPHDGKGLVRRNTRCIYREPNGIFDPWCSMNRFCLFSFTEYPGENLWEQHAFVVDLRVPEVADIRFWEVIA